MLMVEVDVVMDDALVLGVELLGCGAELGDIMFAKVSAFFQ